MHFDKYLQNIHDNRLFKNVLQKEFRFNSLPKNFLEISEGEIIYHAGDNSYSLYLIIKGHIKIKTYSNIGGSTISEKFDNEFFGDTELLSKIPRKSTAMAIEQSVLYKIDEKELKELTKNKSILANLFNPTSAVEETSERETVEPEVSNQVPDNDSQEDAVDGIVSDAAAKSEEFNEPENDLSWNDSNINEISDVINNDEMIMGEEFEDFTSDEEAALFDYNNEIDKFNSSAEEEDALLSNDEINKLEPLFDTGSFSNQFKNGNDSILDQIKKELDDDTENTLWNQQLEVSSSTDNSFSDPVIFNESTIGEIVEESVNSPIVDLPPVPLNNELNKTIESSSNELNQDLARTVAESIFDETKSPLELIQKYTNLLIRNSASAEAKKLLQKILDQTDFIGSAIRAHTDYLYKKITLKTHIFYAENVLNDIFHLIAGYAELRNVKFFKRYEANASIYLDKILFYQACLQIVRFLCDLTENGDSIFAIISRTEDKLVLNFQNNGSLISEELLQSLNEPSLFNANLDLNFAKKIISEHGGTMFAEYNSEKRMCIKLMLPIVK